MLTGLADWVGLRTFLGWAASLPLVWNLNANDQGLLRWDRMIQMAEWLDTKIRRGEREAGGEAWRWQDWAVREGSWAGSPLLAGHSANELRMVGLHAGLICYLRQSCFQPFPALCQKCPHATRLEDITKTGLQTASGGQWESSVVGLYVQITTFLLSRWG